MVGDAIDGEAAAALSGAKGSLYIFGSIAAVAFLLSIAAPVLLALRIEGAIAGILGTMRKIADNELDIEPPKASGSGEVAEFAQMAVVFLENARARDAAFASAEEADVARADIAKALEEARKASEREREAEAARAAAEAERAAADKARTEEDEARRLAEEKAERERMEEDRRRVEAEREAAEVRRREQEERAKNLSQLLAELGGALQLLSRGDLTCRIDAFLDDDFKTLRMDFNEAIQKLKELISGVKSGANEISKISVQVDAASRDLARRTETQAATLEASAASITALSAQVAETAKEAEATRATATAAKANVDESGKVMRDAVTAMDAIEQSSARISSIINVIEDITFQTNLLALNAGVEAARAGEAGRGFAVVASEVRALAQRAADSSQEIRKLIEDSSAQIGDGVRLVKRTGVTLEEIAASFVEISDAVAGFAEGAATQAQSLEKVRGGVDELDAATRENAAMSEETTAAAAELSAEIEGVVANLSAFNIGEETDEGRRAA